MLWIFRLGLLFRYQHAVAVSKFHLHVRDAGPRCCSRSVLDWQLGDSRQFPETGEIALFRNERILFIYVNTPEERCGAGFEKYAAVACIAPRSRLLNSRGLIPIQGQGE